MLQEEQMLEFMPWLKKIHFDLDMNITLEKINEKGLNSLLPKDVFCKKK